MGLRHYEKGRPSEIGRGRVLEPATMKLKDALVPAPVTSQPQLYRLTHEDDPILVRLAVFKTKSAKAEVLKHHIHGLVHRHGQQTLQDAHAITQQFKSPPKYFIHFVTNPQFDRLIIIINQKGQKRILTLRKKLTQTQYLKIVRQWKDVASKPLGEIAPTLWKSTDVREVNKEFYTKVKTKFDDLVAIVEKQGVSDPRHFAVRLIGRYIFCWFLKEKEIIEPVLLKSDTIASTDHFYQRVLLPIFFESLNTQAYPKRTYSADVPKELLPHFDRIPYLNGGLFDEGDDDKRFRKIAIDDWLKSFVQVLEEYDFTVDESSQQYQHVAIDPEMLGRIFENLLASINPETEKTANERKAFGAFYTPREIVEYMVSESLKAYLETQLLSPIEGAEGGDNGKGGETLHVVAEPNTTLFSHTQPKQLKLTTSSVRERAIAQQKNERITEHLQKLFDPDYESNPFGKEDSRHIIEKLEKIKVLDPACGSGAFPMGVLYKLEELYEKVGTVKSQYELRNKILSTNIYGVDIMPMAVEIARLRAWLALVLVNDYKANDPKHNFNVKPLPNLDFKFVTANSLIDLPEDDFVAMMAVKELKEFERLTEKYFDAFDYQKDKLRAEIEKCIDAITREHERALKQIESSMKHEGRLSDSKVKKYREGRARFEQQHKQWQSYKNLFSHQPVEFFTTKYFFPSVKDGFDLVIGNPPYVQLQKDHGQLAQLYEEEGYQTFTKTGDVYQLFYERGLKLLCENGVLAYITSNKWMRTAYGEVTREFFVSQANPMLIVDFGMAQNFESATTYTNILLLQSTTNRQHTFSCRVRDDYQQGGDIAAYVRSHGTIRNYTSESWVAYQKEEFAIIKKIEAQGVKLEDWEITINRGILTGYNDAFIIDGATKDRLIAEDKKSAQIIRPILRGEDVSAFVPDFADQWIIATLPSRELKIEDFPAVKTHLFSFGKRRLTQSGEKWKDSEGNTVSARKKTNGDWFETQDSISYWKDFDKPKIIYPNMTKYLPFAYDESGLMTNQKCFIVTGGHLKYLTAVLNSRLWKFAFRDRFPELLGDTFELSKVFFDKIPIRQPWSISEEELLGGLVNQIITAKQTGQDTTALENEIDLLVYKLYGLTYAEVKVVDPETPITEEEYEAASEVEAVKDKAGSR